MKINKYSYLLIWPVLWSLFLLAGLKSLDPDFGWHLTMGRYILAHGIPRTDPFSYTMPSFPFVDHEWLTNVMWGLWYPFWGMTGMAILYATMTVAALMVAIPKKLWKWSVIPLLLGAGALVTRGGVRPQIGDWLFLAVLLRLVETGIWKRWKWATVGLFWLWANLHGGFALGPAVLGVYLAAKCIWERRVNSSDVLVWILATGATVINPYGIRLWGEVVLQMTDTNLKQYIQEWLPFYTYLELGFWLLAAILVALQTKIKKIPDIPRQVILGCLLLAALTSLRHVPLFIIATIPVVGELWYEFHRLVRKAPEAEKRWKLFNKILVTVCVLELVAEIGGQTWRLATNRGGIAYPTAAISFLKTQNYQGNLFSNYAWGGYLIWNYPDKKVFIDGRMPSWRWPNIALWGDAWGKSAPQGESAWAFKDYMKVALDGQWQEIFRKYHITSVLWNKVNLVGDQRGLINLKNVGWLGFLRNKSGGQKPKNFLDELVKNGWKKVYTDKVAEIYVSPPNTN